MSNIYPHFVLVLYLTSICPQNPVFVLNKSHFCPQSYFGSSLCPHFVPNIGQNPCKITGPLKSYANTFVCACDYRVFLTLCDGINLWDTPQGLLHLQVVPLVDPSPLGPKSLTYNVIAMVYRAKVFYFEHDNDKYLAHMFLHRSQCHDGVRLRGSH